MRHASVWLRSRYAQPYAHYTAQEVWGNPGHSGAPGATREASASWGNGCFSVTPFAFGRFRPIPPAWKGYVPPRRRRGRLYEVPVGNPTRGGADTDHRQGSASRCGAAGRLQVLVHPLGAADRRLQSGRSSARSSRSEKGRPGKVRGTRLVGALGSGTGLPLSRHPGRYGGREAC